MAYLTQPEQQKIDLTQPVSKNFDPDPSLGLTSNQVIQVGSKGDSNAYLHIILLKQSKWNNQTNIYHILKWFCLQ